MHWRSGSPEFASLGWSGRLMGMQAQLNPISGEVDPCSMGNLGGPGQAAFTRAGERCARSGPCEQRELILIDLC